MSKLTVDPLYLIISEVNGYIKKIKKQKTKKKTKQKKKKKKNISKYLVFD